MTTTSPTTRITLQMTMGMMYCEYHLISDQMKSSRSRMRAVRQVPLAGCSFAITSPVPPPSRSSDPADSNNRRRSPSSASPLLVAIVCDASISELLCVQAGQNKLSTIKDELPISSRWHTISRS